MKHGIKGRKLNRDSSHRKSLLRNLSIALINNYAIKTTLPKAKELKPFVEKLITLSKIDNLKNRKNIISKLGSDKASEKLFKIIGPKHTERKGGYTRILKYTHRNGDKASMAYIEIVDMNYEEDNKRKENSVN